MESGLKDLSAEMQVAFGPILDRIGTDTALVEQKLLQAGCESFLLPSRVPQARGIVLMLHGFTAGPWQYEFLAQHLTKAGLHCYAARLPGHGAQTVDGRGDSSLLPQSQQSAAYTAFALQAFEEITQVSKNLNLPIFIIGFSAGGAVAIELLNRFAKNIKRALIIAPLLRLHSFWAHFFLSGLSRVPVSARVTDRLRLSWQDATLREAIWHRPGHDFFHVGNVQALTAYTRTLQRTVKQLKVPTQFVVSACDAKVDLKACVRLAKKSNPQHPLWCFPKADRVPHSMLTPNENPDEKSRLLVYQIAENFLLHEKSYVQLPA